MNGREFLSSANRLATSEHAADLRSATSRAYYAAFHAVFDFLGDCGICFSASSPDAHAKMPQCLDNSNIDAATEIGRRLRSLRNDRNRADYRMDDARFEDAANANVRVAIAERIISAIDELIAEQSNVGAILRPKARTLGITVIDPK